MEGRALLDGTAEATATYNRAAEDYVKTECGEGQTERRCRDAGVLFQPAILESTGVVTAEAEQPLKCLN